MEEKKCPECEFLKGSTDEEYKVFDQELFIMENNNFAAYYSNHPVVPYHVVILPKNHHSRLIEFTPKEWKDYGNLLQTIGIAGSFRSFHLFIPSGTEYGKHLVLHILPAGKEGFSFTWEPKETLDPDELKSLKLRAKEIKQKMPIKGKAILLSPDAPRSSEIAFEDIVPGMLCLLHGTRHNCEYAPPKDAIPPIYQPTFIHQSKVDYLKDDELVTSVTIEGETRAYPVSFLDFHEIVNDVIGDTHFAVSYCPLCASSLVFNRKVLDGSPTNFGVSGFLYQSDLLMYDHATESLWSQIEGKCVYGKQEGKDLDLIPFQLVQWKKWKQAYPDGKILSIDTGYARDYSNYPYGEYEISERTIFPTKKKDEKSRLHPKTIVYGIESGGIAKVYPEDYISDKKIIEDTVGATPLLIVLDEAGGVIALVPVLDGKRLSFKRTDKGLIDKETGLKWTFYGEGMEGTYAGCQLQRRADLLRMFYFAWVAFNPTLEVEIYQNIHEKPSWRERLFQKFKSQ